MKLIKIAKRIAKQGGKVLIICGKAHAKIYAGILNGLGYNVKFLIPIKEDASKIMINMGKKIINLCRKKGISERQIYKIIKEFL